MPRKTRFEVGPLRVVAAGDARGESVHGLLQDLIRDALRERGLLGDDEVDLVVTPELRQLRLASGDLPFTQLDLAVSVAKPGAADPVYLRRVEVETRQRAGEGETAALGRAAATCVDSLVEALQRKFGVLTDSGLGVVR